MRKRGGGGEREREREREREGGTFSKIFVQPNLRENYIYSQYCYNSTKNTNDINVERCVMTTRMRCDHITVHEFILMYKYTPYTAHLCMTQSEVHTKGTQTVCDCIL